MLQWLPESKTPLVLRAVGSGADSWWDGGWWCMGELCCWRGREGELEGAILLLWSGTAEARLTCLLASFASSSEVA